MLLEEILLSEDATVRDAIDRLEKIRCKVVYVVHNNKLKASVSDGDVRRFVINSGGGAIDASVFDIANTSPVSFMDSQSKDVRKFFENSEAWSVPIVNLNNEIIAVCFRNGQVVRRRGLANCQVVIMAGGKGTRLYPFTKILPKALIPVGELPISELIIRSFKLYGCGSFHMIVNYKKEIIKAYFKDSGEYKVNFYDEDEPLGTGGGLSLLKGKITKDFFFTNCDILIDADYSSMFDMHMREKNDITIIAAHYTNSIPYGVVDMDEESRYMGIDEKPSQKYFINTGLYILNPKVLELVPDNTEMSFPQIIDLAKRSDMKVGVYAVSESAYMDMGQLDELDSMQKKLDL